MCTALPKFSYIMPKSYSSDLRWHVWVHVFLKLPAKEVSRLLLISKRSVHRYCGQFMATGTLEPRHHRSGPCPKLLEQDQLILIDLVLTRPGIYLYEVQPELVASTGTVADCSSIIWLWEKGPLGSGHQFLFYCSIGKSSFCAFKCTLNH